MNLRQPGTHSHVVLANVSYRNRNNPKYYCILTVAERGHIPFLDHVQK